VTGDDDCPDDRIVLARRGALDDVQWRALMTHVRACAECRSVWLASRAFDGEGCTESEDERLVDRAAMAALATVAPSRGRPIFRAAVIVAASLAGAAAMANVGMRIQEHRQATASRAEAAVRHAARHERSIAAPSAHAPLEPPVPVPSNVEGAPSAEPPSEASSSRLDDAHTKVERTRLVPSAHHRAPVAASVAPPAVADSDAPAALLFARATAARRSGRHPDAIAAFRQLQREHPRSQEAVVSLVSLADLLDGAEPEAALALLDRYLDSIPGGPLAPEALARKVRLLERLGRGGEAQRSHEELARRFPDWIYGQRRSPAGAAP
jgi:TolA-binding protein